MLERTFGKVTKKVVTSRRRELTFDADAAEQHTVLEDLLRLSFVFSLRVCTSYDFAPAVSRSKGGLAKNGAWCVQIQENKRGS